MSDQMYFQFYYFCKTKNAQLKNDTKLTLHSFEKRVGFPLLLQFPKTSATAPIRNAIGFGQRKL